MSAQTDWPWPLTFEDVTREQLIERVKYLNDLVEEIPDKIRAFPVDKQVSGHFAQVWVGTGLNIAAEITEQEWFKV